MIDTLAEFGLSILNVPHELKINMKWAVSTMKVLDTNTGRLDKSPRNPITGERLSVGSESGWVTFDEASNAGYPAIGMLMTNKDPYTVIDLDKSNSDEANALARTIYNTFESYTEKSFSGNGVHIILKGDNQAGRRKGNVEVYSQERYIICTGKILRNKEIMDGGKPLESLIKSLHSYDNPDTLPIINDSDERESDSQIIAKMFAAANGTSVRKLFETRPGPNDDWSKLDSSLAQHICFYTKNQQQALRLFRASALYRGEGSERKKNGYENTRKYEEDYLLRRTFSRAWYLNEQRRIQSEMSDEAFSNMVEKSKNHSTPDVIDIAKRPQVTANHYKSKFGEITYESFLPALLPPTGLVGEIAKYIYSVAPRPVWEVAIAGALSFISGVAGRHYNINGSGLGLYLIVLAQTGRGKEAANLGITNLINSVAQNVPSVRMFRGPSMIASGQGLIRCMGETNDEDNIPSKLMLLSEFGHTLGIITSRDATAADIRTRQALLDFYSKNSWGSHISESAYADKANNVKSVDSPNICILGDTTPESFFKSISMDIINEGFLPRFVIVEYDGLRVQPNEVMNSKPPTDLVVRVQTLTHQVIAMRDQNQCLAIQLSEEARTLFQDFNDYCDYTINTNSEVAELWNRGHLNALRIAGCLAVGNNLFEPRVSAQDAQWAIEMIKRSVLSISHRMAKGVFGKSDIALESLAKEVIKDYYDTPVQSRKNPDKPDHQETTRERGYIPHSFIYRKLGRKPAYVNNARGVVAAVNNVMYSLIAQGYITELNMREVEKVEKQVLRYGRYYMKGPDYET